MTTAKVSSKGWIVIPSDLRRKYNLHAGTRVVVVDYGGVLSLIPAMDNPVEEAAGLFRDKPPLTGTLLEEHAVERARER